MNPERWKELKALYERAVDLPDKDRRVFLESACKDDPELLVEIQQLFKHTSDSGFLDQSPFNVAKALSRESPRWEPGTVICSRFEIEKFIGAGGMGEVYSAKDRVMGERVALKTIRAGSGMDAESAERFRREVQRARTVVHPGVCRVNELFISDRDGDHAVPFVSMHLLEGETLDARILRVGKLAPAVVQRIVEELAEALAAVHAASLLHRDLKCSNVFLTKQGEVEHAVLTDFGLAIPLNTGSGLSPSSTDGGNFAGTLDYMAPEQLMGSAASVRSDVYALGVMAYRMLTGELPFAKQDALGGVLHRCTRHAPPPSTRVEGVPAHWDAAFDRCIDPEPAGRFSTPQAFSKALVQPPGLLQRAYNRTSSFSRRTLFLILAMLVAVPIGWWLYATKAGVGGSGGAAPRIAVLPFENADSGTQYLSDGIAEEIIDALSYARTIKVISRSSSFRYRGRDPRDVIRDLKADQVLTGTLNRTGDRLRITARLVGRDGTQLWTEHFDKPVAQSYVFQHEIATQLAGILRLRLAPAPQRGTTNAEAHMLYLRARFQIEPRQKVGLETAVDYLNRALERDPEFALAHATLGSTYLLLADYGFWPPGQATPPARESLLKAHALNPDLAETQAALGQLHGLFEWDFRNAESAYRRALTINPNYPEANHWYANFLTKMGRFDEALQYANQALELNPSSVAVNTFVGWAFYYARRYDQARTQAERTLELNRNLLHANVLRAQSCAHLNDAACANESMERIVTLAEDRANANRYRAMVQAIAGERQKAEETVRSLIEEGASRHAANIAYVYAYLGNRDQMYVWLERALANRDPSLLLVKVHASVDPYRQEARFRELLTRVGFK